MALFLQCIQKWWSCIYLILHEKVVKTRCLSKVNIYMIAWHSLVLVSAMLSSPMVGLVIVGIDAILGIIDNSYL